MTTTLTDPGPTLKWLGGPVDVRVEVDTGVGPSSGGLWGSAQWGIDVWGSEDAAWLDVSQYVLEVNTRQGSERWGQRFSAGSFVILVDNTTGIFTPDSDAPSPWHLPYRPGRRIRVVAVPDPTDPLNKVPLISGVIDASTDGYGGAGFDIATAITCSDQLAVWAAHNPLALDTATGVQSTDDRVAAALDLLGVGDRDIQAGVHTLQSSYLAQSTLEECAVAADAEGGAFYAAPDGTAMFRARDWLDTDTRSTVVQGYLGYDTIPIGANSAHVLDVKTSWESARIVNLVQFARVGSALQVVEDVPSQVALGSVRDYTRTDFQNNDDAEVAYLAARHLAAFKDNRPRLEEVTITGIDDPGNADLNRLLWDTRIGDRLAVLVEPPFGWSIEREAHVMAIAHKITGSDWVVTLTLDDAQTVA